MSYDIVSFLVQEYLTPKEYGRKYLNSTVFLTPESNTSETIPEWVVDIVKEIVGWSPDLSNSRVRFVSYDALRDTHIYIDYQEHISSPDHHLIPIAVFDRDNLSIRYSNVDLIDRVDFRYYENTINTNGVDVPVELLPFDLRDDILSCYTNNITMDAKDFQQQYSSFLQQYPDLGYFLAENGYVEGIHDERGEWKITDQDLQWEVASAFRNFFENYSYYDIYMKLHDTGLSTPVILISVVDPNTGVTRVGVVHPGSGTDIALPVTLSDGFFNTNNRSVPIRAFFNTKKD